MNNQRGTVFFYILIGVALFAALSYAVSQSIRLSNDSSGLAIGDSEKNTATIIDIQQFLEAVTLKVYEITNINGVSESLLDFKNDVYKRANNSTNPDNTNSNCTESKCRVFTPYADNGLTPIIFQSAADTTAQNTITDPKNGHSRVSVIDLNGVGSPAPDLVFIIHGIKPQICNLYNQRQGITTTYNLTTTLTSIGETSPSSAPDIFNGSFTTSKSFGYGATEFTGKKSFCAPSYADSSNSRLAIWHVVKAR